MSHIHNITGGFDAAAEYQEHLARLRAGRRARRTAERRGKSEFRTFDSAIEPERESDDDRSGRRDDGDSRRNFDDEQDWPTKA